MKFEELNQWLSLVANLGVLVGIIFLAVELNQNTSMMRAQTRDSVTEKQMNFYQMLVTDSELTRKYVDNGGYLVDPDLFAAGTVFRAQLRMWENEWYQYQQGLFEDEEFAPRVETWKQVLTSQYFRGLWSSQLRLQHAPEFRSEIDQLIE